MRVLLQAAPGVHVPVKPFDIFDFCALVILELARRDCIRQIEEATAKFKATLR